MISVCMTTYNGDRFIKEQIDSILPQLGAEDELIISDDGSTDRTIPIITSYHDQRIRLIEGPRKHSAIRNFENVLKYAKGDIIFTADQDDVWHPDKVAVSLAYLQKTDCIVSNCRVVDANLNLKHGSFYSLNHTKFGKWYNLLVHNGYLGCCMAFRRSVLDDALPFPAYIPQHDIWIGNVAAFRHKLLFIPELLIDYRRHNSNASSTSDKAKSTVVQKIGYRVNMIKGLLSKPKFTL